MDEQHLWIIFGIIFAVLILYDLLVADRHSHKVSSRAAARNVVMYVAVALAFGLLILTQLGQEKATSYVA